MTGELGELDLLLSRVRAQQAKREAELREAFRDVNELRRMILADCAHLVAAIGGYSVPLELEARRAWIDGQMLNDPAFHAKVHTAANLVREYAEYALDRIEQRLADYEVAARARAERIRELEGGAKGGTA